jgi:hypothetical protein
MIDIKFKEMRRTGRIPEIPRAPHGHYDPRVLHLSLQKSVAQRNHVEPQTFSNPRAKGNPD